MEGGWEKGEGSKGGKEGGWEKGEGSKGGRRDERKNKLISIAILQTAGKGMKRCTIIIFVGEKCFACFNSEFRPT